MATPAQVVAEQFSNARTYAENHQAELEVFTDALAAAIYVAPAFDVTFEPITEPTALVMPDRPAALDELEAEFVWDSLGDIASSKPTALVADAPSIAIDDFTEEAPTLDFGTMPVLDFGTVPVLDYGVRPTIPVIDTITVPDAPTLDAVAAPSYLALTTPTFAGVDIHADYLTNLEAIPTLSLVAPTPYSYALGAEYSSSLFTALKATLLTRIAGGTGLDADVEAAIWDRARDRETALAQAEMDEIARMNEALGFQLPTGVMLAQTRDSQRNYYNKLSGQSRDVSIKQAELEQENLKQTIAEAMGLESKLVDYSLALETLSYQTAKTVAENAVQVYNAQVDNFKALVNAYQAASAAYDAIIKGELANVEVFRAEIAAEQAKADTNRTLVEQYKAEIDAGLSQVKIYEAQVAGAKARMEVEQTRLSAAGEEIKAYVATINGETARMEAYKTTVQGETARMEAYKVGVESQVAIVSTYTAKAQAFAAKAGAQAEEARANISYYNALQGAKASEWDAWKARVQGESARFQALSAKSNAVMDGYKIDVSKVEAESNQDIRRWEIGIKQYEATQNYTLQVQKMNTEVIQANQRATLDAAKVGAQVYAQLTSSAYGIIHTSAGVTGSAQTTASNSSQSVVSTAIQYQYSNNTNEEVDPVIVMPVVPATPAV